MNYKGSIVYLRALEPEDYETTFRFRTYEMQAKTCGPIRFGSKAIEKNWALAKATDNRRDIYLAICLVENDKMIGWYSINDIDHLNRKCHCGGIVIGDKESQDGEAYAEARQLAFSYIIDELNMHRITGSCLYEHVLSRAAMESDFWNLEGIERQSVFKSGSYHDVCCYAILRDEYLAHLRQGDYDHPEIRIARAIRRIKGELKEQNIKPIK